MKLRIVLVAILLLTYVQQPLANKILIPMDADGQINHLKAYGVAFAAIKEGTVDWLLNYRGGSFGMTYSKNIEKICKDRNVSYITLKDKEYSDITKEVKGLKYDGAVVKLEKAPKIGVYTPLNKEPWDDAVTLALTYAEIPFDKLYVDEVLDDKLNQYDWLHLHHADFTGQYGKFWAQMRGQQWYINDHDVAEHMAARHGFKKVSQMQLAVVKKISAFVRSGGNLFAMCSATDTYDIALAADGVDICETQFDGDPMDSDAQDKLNFNKCFAFRDFTLVTSPYIYEYSNIDNSDIRKVEEAKDFFTLNSFPVNLDIVPVMLCQNHTKTIKGFMGQTTAFRNEVLKPGVLVMGETKSQNEARYIHGEYGRGSWTFYGGHDPEDYRHMVNAAPTNLAFHSTSPGYRLILNNVLSPAAKKVFVPTVEVKEAPGKDRPIYEDIVANPTKDKVKLETDPSSSDIKLVMPPTYTFKTVDIVITNSSGKQILKQTSDTKNIRISLHNLVSGIYLILVNGEYAGKIMKD
jgi:hypothetical protein